MEDGALVAVPESARSGLLTRQLFRFFELQFEWLAAPGSNSGVKYRVIAFDRLGGRSADTVTQVDQYFNHPARDFAQTDEALRLRRVGEVNFITYKGPKLDAITKSRHEIELPLPSGDAAATGFAELLTTLGFQPVAEHVVTAGRLGGMGIDVYEQEADVFFRDLSSEVIHDDVLARLMSFPNVIITGHQAFFTREATATISETTLANIAEFQKGLVLTNEVRVP
jgi:hypothetical protein